MGDMKSVESRRRRVERAGRGRVPMGMMEGELSENSVGKTLQAQERKIPQSPKESYHQGEGRTGKATEPQRLTREAHRPTGLAYLISPRPARNLISRNESG